jgi:hypothetical protein
LSNHYAVAEIDELTAGTDISAPKITKPLINCGKIVTAAMQRLQPGLACPPIALHMQHDYLPVIAAQRCLLEQN